MRWRTPRDAWSCPQIGRYKPEVEANYPGFTGAQIYVPTFECCEFGAEASLTPRLGRRRRLPRPTA